MADKGEIRRFKIEKVVCVCGHCANGLKGTVGKRTGGGGEGKRRSEIKM